MLSSCTRTSATIYQFIYSESRQTRQQHRLSGAAELMDWNSERAEFNLKFSQRFPEGYFLFPWQVISKIRQLVWVHGGPRSSVLKENPYSGRKPGASCNYFSPMAGLPLSSTHHSMPPVFPGRAPALLQHSVTIQLQDI